MSTVLAAFGKALRSVLHPKMLALTIWPMLVALSLWLGLAWLLTLGGSPVPSMLPVFYVPARDLLLGVGIVILLGIVAGIFPAVQAMRLRIAEALRRNA